MESAVIAVIDRVQPGQPGQGWQPNLRSISLRVIVTVNNRLGELDLTVVEFNLNSTRLSGLSVIN